MSKGWLLLLFELHCSFYFCWVAIFQFPGFFLRILYLFLSVFSLLNPWAANYLVSTLFVWNFTFLTLNGCGLCTFSGLFPQLSTFLRNLSQGCTAVLCQNQALYHSQLNPWEEGYLQVTPLLVYLTGSGTIPRYWKTANCVPKLLSHFSAHFGQGQLALPRQCLGMISGVNTAQELLTPGSLDAASQ